MRDKLDVGLDSLKRSYLLSVYNDNKKYNVFGCGSMYLPYVANDVILVLLLPMVKITVIYFPDTSIY